MICKNCGAEIPEGSLFCVQCGERAEAAQLVDQPVQYELPGAQYPPAPPAKKPLSKKMKAIIFGGVGAVALAVVLLVFTLSAGAGGLLSGKTVQTKFVNENAAFIAEILSSFNTADTSKMATQPFDYTAEVSMDAGYGSQDTEMAFAYDKQVLGMSVDSEYSSSKVLLVEDTLYVESNGYVTAIEFDVDEDLSAAMSLQQRITMLLKSYMGDIDYRELAETLVNSIPEECFEKTNSGFTMTLDADSLVEMLNNFSDAVKNNDELNEAVEDLIKEMTGFSYDLSDLADLGADAIEAYGDYIDFELVWELGYEKGKPASMTIEFEEASGYYDFTVEIGFKEISGGSELTVDCTTPGGYSDFSFEMTTTKISGGFGIEGSAEASNDEITFEGSQTWVGDEFALSLNAESDSGYEYSYEVEGVFSVGMPEKPVADDRRFEMDTDDAYEVDLSDIFGMSYGF